MMHRYNYRVWDGEVMNTVDTLSFPVGGIRWYGVGVGSGWCYVNPEYFDKKPKVDTLLQCTGLKDVIDNLIWEGDLCELQTKEIAEIVYSPIYAAFMWTGTGAVGSHLLIPSDGAESLEVIGNKYENPELLI